VLSSDKTFNYELNKENLINILNKNFFFDVVNDETFGKMVKLHPYDAFSLSLVHGAPYLVNEAGFSLKGRFEVLIHRGVFQNNRYIYTPGLFGRKLDRTLCAGESPYYIKKRFPQIFKGEKYVLFIDIPKNSSSNIEKKIYDELKKRTDPSNYLLIKNFEGGSNSKVIICIAFFAHLLNIGWYILIINYTKLTLITYSIWIISLITITYLTQHANHLCFGVTKLP